MSDPGTRAFLGIYLVTCLIVYQRERAIAAPSEEIIKTGLRTCAVGLLAQPVRAPKALVRIAPWMLLVMLPIARVAIM